MPGRKLIVGGRPRAAGLRMPVLVLLAEHSRTHDAAKVAEKARAVLPQAEVTVLPGATHHTLPLAEPEQLNEHLIHFLG